MKQKVVLAYSGGLDTTYCAVWLREQGYEVHTVCVQTGGFTADELAEAERRARFRRSDRSCRGWLWRRGWPGGDGDGDSNGVRAGAE